MCCGSSVSVGVGRTAARAGGDATPASDRRYLLLHTLAAHGNYRCLLSSGLGSPSGGMSVYCSKAWAPLTARQLEDELALLSQLAQSAAAVPAHALASVMVRALLCLSGVECVGHAPSLLRAVLSRGTTATAVPAASASLRPLRCFEAFTHGRKVGWKRRS